MWADVEHHRLSPEAGTVEQKQIIVQDVSHEVLIMKQPNSHWPVLTMILMLFSFTLTWGQSESQATKKLYQPNGSEGYVTGTVSLTGTPPRATRIDMSADPACYEHNPNPRTKFFVVEDGRLADALIYVKAGISLNGVSFETPDTNVVLDQRGCFYVPRVLGVRVNQTLEVRNSDNTVQNVHPTPKNNPDSNRSQPPSSDPLMLRFAHAEIVIPFKDNQHPWKKAYVGVFAHPFFAVSDSKGEFTIGGLPPGDYTIAAWHEQFGEKTFEVTVYPRSTQSLDIKFDMAEQKIWR
jgi:hypothetical protein